MNRPTYPADLNAPGAIDELIAFHRATFGGFRMEDTATATADKTDGASADATAAGSAADDKKDDATAALTQADVDRIVKDRVARERSKFADYDDLKSKASKLDEIETANATEQEKAVKTARDEATQAERERSNTVLVRAEARALAAEANFQDPRDAVAMLEAEGHLKDIKVDDQGDVDTEALKAKIAEVADKKKYLLKPEQSATAGQAGIGVTGGDGQRAGSLTEAITAAVTKQQRTR